MYKGVNEEQWNTIRKIGDPLDCQKKLYDLIRNRTLASQMEDEISETTTVILKNEDKSNSLKATGRVVIFEGFRKAFSYDENEEINNHDNKQVFVHILYLMVETYNIDHNILNNL